MPKQKYASLRIKQHCQKIDISQVLTWLNIQMYAYRKKRHFQTFYPKLVLSLPVLLRYITEGNSQYINIVRSIGNPSENWTETLKFPTLIEGIT